jgi:hypothetical protein
VYILETKRLVGCDTPLSPLVLSLFPATQETQYNNFVFSVQEEIPAWGGWLKMQI